VAVKVSVGTILREREPPHRLWEIVRIIDPQHGFRHARLRLVADHDTTMILSCNALEDDEIYLPAEPGAIA
jgi:hypothetical protein